MTEADEHDALIRREAIHEAARHLEAMPDWQGVVAKLAAIDRLRALADSPPPASGGADADGVDENAEASGGSMTAERRCEPVASAPTCKPENNADATGTDATQAATSTPSPSGAPPSTAVAAGDPLLLRVSAAIHDLSVADSQWRLGKGHVYSFSPMLADAWANLGRVQAELDRRLAAPARADDSPPASDQVTPPLDNPVRVRVTGAATTVKTMRKASPPIPPSEPCARISDERLALAENYVRRPNPRDLPDRRTIPDNLVLDLIADLRDARAALAARSGEGA